MSTSQLKPGPEVSEADPEPAVTESSGGAEPEGDRLPAGRREGAGLEAAECEEVAHDADEHERAGRERAGADGTTGGRGGARGASGEYENGDGAELGNGSEAAGSDPGPRGSKRWVRRSCAALIIVVAIVSSVLAGVFGWKLSNRDAVDTAAQQALSTAQTYAVTLTSIDSQHIDDDYTHVLDGATGDFKNMYSQSSAQLKKMLIDNKARSVGKVVDASVRSASTDQVVVMLFVDQEITNTVSPDPRIDRSRIIMTMRSVGGRWLASKVEMA